MYVMKKFLQINEKNFEKGEERCCFYCLLLAFLTFLGYIAFVS